MSDPKGRPASSETSQPDPLRGLRVLELGQIYNGPYAGFLLAAAGAEVVKVEPPGGERLRKRAPVNGAEYPFMVLNTGKQSIVVDLKTDSGRERLLRLVAHADVVIENFSTGTLDRLGVGYEVMRSVNPRLIYASSTGFDPRGPNASTLAMDLTVQAMSGMIGATGFPDGPPVKAGGAVCDFMAGVHLFGGIVSALYGRSQTGIGSRVEVSMIDAVLPTLLSNIAPVMMKRDVRLERTGNHHGGGAESPYNVYRASDGYVAVICVHEEQWKGLLVAIGREDLGDDQRFVTNADRVKNVELVDAVVESFTAVRSRDEVARCLQAAGVPVAPVRTLKEVGSDPELFASGMLQMVPQPDIGPVPLMSSPIRYEGLRHRIVSAAPTLGSDDDKVDERWANDNSAQDPEGEDEPNVR